MSGVITPYVAIVGRFKHWWSPCLDWLWVLRRDLLKQLKHVETRKQDGLNMLKQFAVSVPCADYIDYKWESWFSRFEMIPWHAGAVSACVRNVCWVPLLVLHIFYIFRLDHLTSTVPYFTHSPRMLWTRTCAVQTFRGRHQVLQSEGFRSGTLCTTLHNTCAEEYAPGALQKSLLRSLCFSSFKQRTVSMGCFWATLATRITFLLLLH